MKKRNKNELEVKKEKISKIQGNSLGASGFTLGVIGIVSLGLFGTVFSLIGFTFCLIQQRHKPTKLGKVGMILNILGFVLSLLWIFIFAPMITRILQQASSLY